MKFIAILVKKETLSWGTQESVGPMMLSLALLQLKFKQI